MKTLGAAVLFLLLSVVGFAVVVVGADFLRSMIGSYSDPGWPYFLSMLVYLCVCCVAFVYWRARKGGGA